MNLAIDISYLNGGMSEAFNIKYILSVIDAFSAITINFPIGNT